MGRFTRMLVLAGLTVGGLTLNGACLFVQAEDEPPVEQRSPSLECDTDDQCSHLDDGDACYGPAFCDITTAGEVSRCDRQFLQDDDTCQCESGSACSQVTGFEQHPCNVLTCEDHLCGEEISPAGEADAIRQVPGDCAVVMCDGALVEGEVVDDVEDLPDDANLCTVDTCSDLGPRNDAIEHGELCVDNSGHCYNGTCFKGCVPMDLMTCGDEGPSEPENNDGTTAIRLPENSETCGMLDGDDFDWYEMNLIDEDFVTDIFELTINSSARDLEVCVFMDCHGTTNALGLCSTKLNGPHNSIGCCFRGDPAAIRPVWDIDCADQTDDGGTMYIAVSAPGGDDCETYSLSAHY
jgi:hypothetical protein